MIYKISDFAEACWRDVFDKIKGAAVYIDHSATECLHWLRGDKAFLSLIDAGAHSIHEMSMFNFQYVRVQGCKKAVMIITSTDAAFYKKALNMIIQKNLFESCIIVCAIHQNLFQYTSVSPVTGQDSYENLRWNVMNWMNQTNISQKPFVDVIFRPIFIAPITKNVFVSPPIEMFMPPINGIITNDYESNVNYFVSSLHSLFTHFNLIEDIYTMGKLSEYIAKKLKNLPAAINRRKRLIGESGVALILIDRTLDLCTATKNNTEPLLSRILSTLPHLPHHNNDVAVNMTPLCPDLEESPLSMTVPGCIATKVEEDFELLLAEVHKDGLLTLYKWLLEMSSSDMQSPRARLSTRVTVHSLEKFIHTIRDTKDVNDLVKYSKKLQIIIAVIQALKSHKTAQLDLIISLEKLILQNLAVSKNSTSVLSQISNIIKTRSIKGLDMENVLVLLIHIYALAGTEIHFSMEQKNQLQSALSNAIFEDIQRCNTTMTIQEASVYQQTLLLLGVTDVVTAKLSAERITEQLMTSFYNISKQRENLQNYKSVITQTSPQEMAQCPSLIEQLVNDLINPSKPEIKDLQRQSSSFISAGLNLLLKGRVAHHPMDNDWVIIYIVGGITAEEAKIINEVSSQQNIDMPQITLAGCRLLNPLDVTDKVLLSNVRI